MLRSASPSSAAFKEASQLPTASVDSVSRRGTLQIEAFKPELFEPASPPSRPDSTFRRLTGHRRAGSVAAAMLAIALHAVLVSSALTGAGNSRLQRPQPIGGLIGASTLASGQVLEWIDLSAAETGGRTEPPKSPESPAVNPPLIKVKHELLALRMPVFSIPTDAVSPSQAPSSSPAAGDSSLYGQYVGQIDARIKRAWLRPRTAIGAPLFKCRVQVVQDLTGTIEEIRLGECNGTERWRASLVTAINAASPLPAPPVPGVFSHVIRLYFESRDFDPALDTRDFESEYGALSDNSTDPLSQLADQLKQSNGAVIELRMQGSRTPAFGLQSQGIDRPEPSDARADEDSRSGGEPGNKFDEKTSD